MVETKSYIKSLRKAMSVLRCFTPQQLELTGTEIARKVGTHKSTAHRILLTLNADGLVEKNENTGKYRIGPMLYALGSLYLSTTDILKAADPVVKLLNDLTSEAINVSILSDGNVVFIMHEEPRYALRIARHVGTIFTAYASSTGKALLSELTEAELDSLIPQERLRPMTNKTIATKAELKLELEQIRKTGISFSREESYEGVEGIASVVRDDSGKAVAAMSISVPVFRSNEDTRERLAKLVRLGASLISYRLGYQDIVNPVHDIVEIRRWWEQAQSSSARI